VIDYNIPVMVRARLVKRCAGAAALAVGALLVPPGDAAAATLHSARGCYASGERMLVIGVGFMPNVTVTVFGQGAPATNGAGAFMIRPRAPRVPGLRPRATTVKAKDPSGLTATIHVPVVSRPYGTNAPLAGSPRARTTWRFAGFFGGDKPIYGHFRTRGRTVATYRFGVAHGACGTLRVRAPRVPVRSLRPGRWRLKLDQEREYRRGSPGRIVRFRISPS
jgi:hypothetical protein